MNYMYVPRTGLQNVVTVISVQTAESACGRKIDKWNCAQVQKCCDTSSCTCTSQHSAILLFQKQPLVPERSFPHLKGGSVSSTVGAWCSLSSKEHLVFEKAVEQS